MQKKSGCRRSSGSISCCCQRVFSMNEKKRVHFDVGRMKLTEEKKKQIIDGAMNLHNTNVVHWSERSFISHLLSSACMFTAEKKKEMCKRNLHLGG